jgi:hypothetical protein
MKKIRTLIADDEASRARTDRDVAPRRRRHRSGGNARMGRAAAAIQQLSPDLVFSTFRCRAPTAST